MENELKRLYYEFFSNTMKKYELVPVISNGKMFVMDNEEFDIGEEVMVTKGFGRTKGKVGVIMYDTDAFGLNVTKYGVTIEVDGSFEYYPSWMLEHVKARRPALISLCECGSDKVGHPRHSTWCPIYRSE